MSTAEAFTADRTDAAPWGVWTLIWRPLRGRWCLVLNSPDRTPWTADELATEPALAYSFRPRSYTFGTVSDALDEAAKLIPPYMDLPEDSPFYTRALGRLEP